MNFKKKLIKIKVLGVKIHLNQNLKSFQKKFNFCKSKIKFYKDNL